MDLGGFGLTRYGHITKVPRVDVVQPADVHAEGERWHQIRDGVIAGLIMLHTAWSKRFMGEKMVCRVVQTRCRC
jgi:hypothetical protein